MTRLAARQAWQARVVSLRQIIDFRWTPFSDKRPSRSVRRLLSHLSPYKADGNFRDVGPARSPIHTNRIISTPALMAMDLESLAGRVLPPRSEHSKGLIHALPRSREPVLLKPGISFDLVRTDFHVLLESAPGRWNCCNTERQLKCVILNCGFQYLSN